jgi:hypothetical protein
MKSFKIKYGEIQNGITEITIDFPKYTTQLLNLANQNKQGTMHGVVGHLSDLIQEIPRQKLQRVGRLVFTRKSECRCRCNKTKLSDRLDTPYRSASPEEESQGIDGYIGE